MPPSQDYLDCARRGYAILAKISSTSTTQSQWTDYSQLVDNGWEPVPKNDFFYEETSGIANLLEDGSLNLSKSHEHNKTINVLIYDKYDQKFAFYCNTYNVVDGTILALSLKSPDGKVKEGGNKDDVVRFPDLKHWSDLTFLMWQQQSADLLKGLKRVLHCIISNKVTTGVIEEVLGQERVANCKYPGHEFQRSGPGDDFAALLGTPNGMGTGHLLAEHQEQFGRKVVQSVRVFRDEDDWYLLLNVG